MEKKFTISLLGNPNCGKTTLFNVLTGSKQKTGNWSGVTVDKKTGFFNSENHQYELVDLPGVYSLNDLEGNGSLDEKIARDFILSKKNKLVINIVDGSNLERNLYLTTQLLEMKVPTLLVVNMMDVLKSKGLKLDLKALSSKIGCPVIGIIASKKRGVNELITAIDSQINKLSISDFKVQYPEYLEFEINKISYSLEKHDNFDKNDLRYFAVSYLESNGFGVKELSSQSQQTISESLRVLSDIDEPDLIIADSKYTRVTQILDNSLDETNHSNHKLTQIIDNIVMNKFLGIPIFLFVMYMMFFFSINIGGALQPIFDEGSSAIFIDGAAWLCNYLSFPPFITAVIAQGFGGGVNTLLPFIPQIGLLFLYLSFLEDSGYMARAAFVVDRAMQSIGLPGKSFVPLIVGFGCNTPAISATRTLESQKDRILTAMMAPLVTCGARLAIFGVFAAAFFHGLGSFLVFSLYVLGILVAIGTAIILKKTLLIGESLPNVMEMPLYHVPHIKTVLITTWTRLKGFVIKAGKLIIPICMIVMGLNSITMKGELVTPDTEQNSVLSDFGRAVTPIFKPMGVKDENWPATVGLLTGTLAKEVVVGTLNTLYSKPEEQNNDNDKFDLVGELKTAWDDTIDGLRDSFSITTFLNPVDAAKADADMSDSSMGSMYKAFGGLIPAYAYLIFVLLYIPCVSTIGAISREIGKNWAYLSTLWGVVIAYSLAVIFYQTATFYEHMLSSSIWILFSISLVMITIYLIKISSNKLDWSLGKKLNNNNGRIYE
ncbi:ferrous iron transport protein B [Paraphotobacterium marinum]|uniref:Ferrous iron transport protein B n=1 Tax=Paraphotobacterium marinum TaxID=1755811 RepID=A0A220VCY8_9GAMM|nr:Fe(2+) transporter permease subunit FeoB [Paraphotobacterium marinum]ASK78207.1 ferrous iron transport protein B [Paraphotobacterium marinum]